MAFSTRFSNVHVLQKDMLHLLYGRTCCICITEGHVTFALRKDMLHLFALRKDMLDLGYGGTCYIWVTEGHVTFADFQGALAT